MKTNVVQYDEETPAKEIYRFLARASVPRMVVVHDGRPTGVVSRATLLRWLRNWATARRPGSAHPDTAAGRGARAGILRATDAGNRCLATLRARRQTPGRGHRVRRRGRSHATRRSRRTKSSPTAAATIACKRPSSRCATGRAGVAPGVHLDQAGFRRTAAAGLRNGL